MHLRSKRTIAKYPTVAAFVLISAALLLAVSAIFAPATLFATTSAAQNPVIPLLSQQDLAAYAKPSIVRIYVQSTGTVSLPVYTVDLINRRVVFTSEFKAPEPFQEAGTGSGFVINPDGYIITNSHVADSDHYTSSRINDDFRGILLKNYYTLSAADKKRTDDLSDTEINRFIQDSTAAISARAKINAQTAIFVLPESSPVTNGADIVRVGIPAKVIFVNKKYAFDQKDVALLKIDQENLPSLSIDDSADLTAGGKVSIIGFPSNANLTLNSVDTISSLTQGAVTAVKDSGKGEFKIYQTDAKSSRGSSGSPLLDAAGKIVGIVTYNSPIDVKNGGGGDNFTSAISADLITDVLSENKIKNTDGSYQTHFLAGLALLNNKHCEQALIEFEKAKGDNYKFSFGVNKVLAPYVERCNAMVAAGLSIDSSWDAIRIAFFEGRFNTLIFTVIGILALFVISFVIFRLLKKIRKDEKIVEELTHRLEKEEHRGLPTQ